MKKTFLAILAIAIVVLGMAPMGYAKINYGGEYVLASNGTTTTTPAPSAVKSNGECKPTVVSSAISDEKLAQLAREIRLENQRKAAALKEELYGRKGSAKNPKGGVIGKLATDVADALKRVSAQEEKTTALEEAASDLDERLSAVEKTINGDGKKVKGLKKEIRETKAVASDAQKVAYEGYNQSVAGLVLGVIGIILGILALAWLACMFFNNRRAAAAGHTP